MSKPKTSTRMNLSPAEKQRRSEWMSKVRQAVPKADTPEGAAFQQKAKDARKAAKEEKELLTKVTRYLKMQLNDTNIEKFTKKMLEQAINDPSSRAGQFVMNILYNEEDVMSRLHMLEIIDEAESGREISTDETESSVSQ